MTIPRLTVSEGEDDEKIDAKPAMKTVTTLNGQDDIGVEDFKKPINPLPAQAYPHSGSGITWAH